MTNVNNGNMNGALLKEEKNKSNFQHSNNSAQNQIESKNERNSHKIRYNQKSKGKKDSVGGHNPSTSRERSHSDSNIKNDKLNDKSILKNRNGRGSIQKNEENSKTNQARSTKNHNIVLNNNNRKYTRKTENKYKRVFVQKDPKNVTIQNHETSNNINSDEKPLDAQEGDQKKNKVFLPQVEGLYQSFNDYIVTFGNTSTENLKNEAKSSEENAHIENPNTEMFQNKEFNEEHQYYRSHPMYLFLPQQQMYIPNQGYQFMPVYPIPYVHNPYMGYPIHNSSDLNVNDDE